MLEPRPEPTGRSADGSDCRGEGEARAAGSTSVPSETFLYDAFACYATDPDRDLVRDVEAFLESLHRNSLIEQAHRRRQELCVDGSDFKLPRRAELSTAPPEDDPVFHLVIEHMKLARRFVVFVGPKSREHPWVTREIDWWLDHRNPADLVIAVTHGHDPMREREQTFPRRLLEANLDRSLWFDLRGWRHREAGGVAVRPYVEERLRLAASLMEPPAAPSELIASWRAGARRQRRRALLWSAFGLLFAAVVLTALVFAVNAWSDSSRHARASGLALVARLTSEAADNRSINALAYAASSIAVEPTPQGYVALIRTSRLLSKHLWTTIHDDGVHAVDLVAFLDGDRMIASAGWAGVLQFARAADGAQLAKVKLAGRATALQPHPTQRLLAIATQLGVDLISWVTGAGGVELKRVGHADLGRVRGIAFTPDGRRLVVGSFDGTLAELDLDTAALQGWQPRRTEVLHDAIGAKVGINGVALEPASGQLVVAEITGTIYCLKMTDWTAPPRRALYTTEIFAMAQHPTMPRLAMADADGGWLIFNPTTCSIDSRSAPTRGPETIARDANGVLRSAPRFERPRTGIAYSPDGALLGIASHDATVRIVAADGGALIRLMVHPAMTRAVAFASDRKRVATGSDDGHIHLWDISSGPELWSLAGIEDTAVDPKGDWIAGWSDDRTLRLMSIHEGAPIDQVRLPDNPSWAEPVVTGDGGYLVVRIGGSTRAPTFSVQVDQQRLHLASRAGIENPNTPGEVAPILELQPADGGTLIATRDDDQHGSIRLRDAGTAKQLFVRTLAEPVVITASGGMTAAGTSTGEVDMFDTQGATLAALRAPGRVTALALGRDANRLLVGYSSNDAGGACLCFKEGAVDVDWRHRILGLITWFHRSPATKSSCQIEAGHFQCRSLSIIGRPSHVQFAPDGQAMAIATEGGGTDDGTLLLVRAVDDFEPRILTGVGRMRDVAFSPDGRWLVAGGMDRAATIYDVGRVAAVAVLPFANPIQRVGWIPQHPDLLMTLDGISPGFLRVWAWQPDKLIAAACARWPVWFRPAEEPLVPKPNTRGELCK
ncbi:MAG: repeat protein [Gammaproteobacteria bacterium]|nr:repeat protein [Gammaproteobacteria bacterium]